MKHNAKEISDAFWQKRDYAKEGIIVQCNADGSKLFIEGVLYAEFSGNSLSLKDNSTRTATTKQIFSGLLSGMGAKPITGKKFWKHGKEDFVSGTKTIKEWRNA